LKTIEVHGKDPLEVLESLWTRHQSHKNIGTLPYDKVIRHTKECLAKVREYKTDIDVWEVGLPVADVKKELNKLMEDLKGAYADVQQYIGHARGIAGGSSEDLRQRKKNWCNARKYWSDHVLEHIEDETDIPEAVGRVVAQVQLP
jgi:hypothetical protein